MIKYLKKKNLKLLHQNFLKLDFFFNIHNNKNKIKLINIKLKQKKYYNKFSYLKYNLKLNQISLNLVNLNILMNKNNFISNITKNFKFNLILY